MKEIPILFSAPMVRAILEGRKTQTRRLVKGGMVRDLPQLPLVVFRYGYIGVEMPCPYGQPGDQLWVRETTVNVEDHGYVGPVFAASDEGRTVRDWGLSPDPDDCTDIEPEDIRLRPAIHMPKAWARIWLEVTSVRVERLHSISEVDAKAEGIEQCEGGAMDYLANDYAQGFSSVASFRSLWESINGAGSWDANHWVWVVAFKRLEAG